MEDPAGVGAVRTCDTMRHHDGIINLPLRHLSFIVAADLVLAIRGAIRAARVSAPMVMRSSIKSECAGTITFEGMPRSAQRCRRRFAARSPRAAGTNGPVLVGLVGIVPAQTHLGLAMEKDDDLTIGPPLPAPVEGSKGIAVAHALHQAVPQVPWRWTVAVKMGEGLGEPKVPLNRTGRFASEQVAGLDRNRRPLYVGLRRMHPANRHADQ